MKRTRHTPEQIIRKLREAERLLASGKDVEEVCRSLEVSLQTYQRWKAQYQARRPEEVARLKVKGSKTRSASCCPSVLVDEPS